MENIIYLLFLLIFFVVALYLCVNLVYVFTWLFTNPPSIPTDKKTRKVFIKAIKKYNPKIVEQEAIIYDLGSGFGHLAIDVAKNFPNSKVSGYEIFFLPYFFSKIHAKFKFANNVTFNFENLFKKDLSQVDIIVSFLSPVNLHELEEKFNNELKQGAILFSNQYKFPNITPTEVIKHKLAIGSRFVYVYKKS